MAIYAVSDIHACISKFGSQIPNDAQHIFVLGDMFDKGCENRETILWLIKNINNPKYTFIFGNHDVTLFTDVYGILNKKRISGYGFDNKFSKPRGVKDLHKSSKVALRMLKNKEITFNELFSLIPKFKWYATYKGEKFNYILSHASWQFNRNFKNQDKKNLVYDNIKLKDMILKNKSNVRNYASFCLSKNIKHVMGHYVCDAVFNTNAPVIFYNGVFNYIDNHGNKNNHDYYFMRLD